MTKVLSKLISFEYSEYDLRTKLSLLIYIIHLTPDIGLSI